MTKFIKQITRPGKYRVMGLDGQRRDEHLPAARLKKLSETFNSMIDAGLKIPAPWKHDLNSKPHQVGQESKDNAGFWNKSWIAEDGSWWGELEVPNEADASKVGTTVQEVSPLIKDFTDGAGKNWGEAPYHIALVTHPIDGRKQDNFKPVANETGIALALSGLMMADDPNDGRPDGQGSQTPNQGTPAKGANIKAALEVLQKVGLKLPPDTTPDNLIEYIIVAGEAVAAATGGADDNDSKNEPTEEPAPIAMGGQMPTPAETAALAFASKQATAGYRRRIEALVNDGKINATYVEKNLNPLFTGFQLSLDDKGEAKRNSLDDILEALEGLPKNVGITGRQVTVNKAGKAKVDGFGLSLTEEQPGAEHSDDNPLAVTDEQANNIVKQQLALVGQAAS